MSARVTTLDPDRASDKLLLLCTSTDIAFIVLHSRGDMVHVMMSKRPAWEFWLGIVEDGGEMVVMSVIVRFVFRAWTVVSRI